MDWRSRAEPSDDRHAAHCALSYYSHCRVFDYTYGLTEPEVARLVARHGRRFDTPTDPALAALWRARVPDYLLEDAAMMDYIVAQAGGTRERFSIHGIWYSVVEQFPIGNEVQWVLARRTDKQSLVRDTSRR